MRYNIKHLALGTACVAGLLWFYRTAPTAGLSLLLLTPFPILLFLSRPLWKRGTHTARAVYISSLLLAAFAFYVGFAAGPLNAFLLYGWPVGVARAIKRVEVSRPLYEPIRLLREHAPNLWSPMEQYVIDWQSLGEEEEEVMISPNRQEIEK